MQKCIKAGLQSEHSQEEERKNDKIALNYYTSSVLIMIPPLEAPAWLTDPYHHPWTTPSIAHVVSYERKAKVGKNSKVKRIYSGALFSSVEI